MGENMASADSSACSSEPAWDDARLPSVRRIARRHGAYPFLSPDRLHTDGIAARHRAGGILNVATAEFADRGYAGARVDEIAAKTQTSKRMIYYHFGGKDGLYRAVLERAYAGIRASERLAGIEALPADQALVRIVTITLDYHADHPDFVRLVMDENIRRGVQIDTLEQAAAQNRSIITLLASVLARGVGDGLFRPDVDALQLHLMISALAFYPIANRYTVASNFAIDMTLPEARAAHGIAVTELILRYAAR
jgi:AcrR family transcriptional regulator